jgi:glycosyltransferase involved in cell wall biosynthesis
MLSLDGEIAATHEAGGYQQWQPFIEIFSRLTIMARLTISGPAVTQATGPRVEFASLPDYNGLGHFALRLPKLVRVIWRGVTGADLYLLRLPEPLSLLAGLRCVLQRQSFVTIVVGDISTLARISLPRPIAMIAARPLVLLVRFLVRRAAGSIFVTQRVLQQSFPPPRQQPTLARSNVRLERFLLPQSRVLSHDSRFLISIGSQQSNVKGHDVAIEALARLRARDHRYHLTLLGDGRTQPELRALAARLHVSDAVEFRGHVSSAEEVRSALEEADLIVVPSRSEGLPRALLEGMATGLPAVATAVGGIVELLSPQCLVPIEDPHGLARAISRVFDTPGLWTQLSSENAARAAEIADSTSDERLRAFFEQVDARLRTAS